MTTWSKHSPEEVATHLFHKHGDLTLSHLTHEDLEDAIAYAHAGIESYALSESGYYEGVVHLTLREGTDAKDVCDHVSAVLKFILPAIAYFRVEAA